MKKRRKKQLKRKIGFTAVAVVLFFLVVELICRFVFPGITGQLPFWKFDNPHLEMPTIYDHDPVLFWKLHPNNKGYEVNSQGFRGPEATIQKEKNEFRVICLGDSCTFGVGPTPILAGQTYPAVLQELLEKAMPGKKVSVLNFGCPGYTSFQGRLLLKNKGLEYKPNVVTAYFGMNDSFPAIGFPDAEQRPMVQPPVLPAPARTLLRNCCLHESMVRLIYGARLTAKKAEGNAERVPVEDYKLNLAEIKNMGKENGFSTFFIDPPFLDESGAIRRSDHYMFEPRIDLYGAFAKAISNGAQPIFGPPDNIHPTIEGHQIAAETIAKRIIEDKTE